MSEHSNNTTKGTANLFPVFKFDYNFKVIQCNEPARPLLNYWNCGLESQIPISILERHPEIYAALKGTKIPDINVQLDDQVIRCSVVAFPEAGYIGIYGYMFEFAETVREKITLQGLNLL